VAGVWARETEAGPKNETTSESKAPTEAMLLDLESGDRRFQRHHTRSDFQRITSNQLRTADVHYFGSHMSITFRKLSRNFYHFLNPKNSVLYGIV
jgi:hypothetical protein